MRYLTIKDVCEKLKLSRSTIYNKNSKKCRFHDASFPKPRRLGERCVRWVEAEIDAWMSNPGVIPNKEASCVPA